MFADVNDRDGSGSENQRDFPALLLILREDGKICNGAFEGVGF